MTEEIRMYEDAFQDIGNSLGEIDSERTRYLLSIDEFLEEMRG